MSSFLRMCVLTLMLSSATFALTGCGDSGHDPATEPASPAAEDQPVTDAPEPAV